MAATYGDDLVVLAFPSHSFNQEFKEAEKVAAFWKDNFDYSPDFLAQISSVKGDDMNEPYKFLQRCFPGPITWNYSSWFLVDRDGTVAARYEKESWEEIEKGVKALVDTPATGHLNLPDAPQDGKL